MRPWEAIARKKKKKAKFLRKFIKFIVKKTN